LLQRKFDYASYKKSDENLEGEKKKKYSNEKKQLHKKEEFSKIEVCQCKIIIKCI